MSVLFRGLDAYRVASRTWPLPTAFVTCFIKGSASDAVAQTSFAPVHSSSEASSEGSFLRRIDWRRNAAFALFSGAYLGVGQHFVYNVAFSRLFGRGTDVATATKKVAADAFGHVPFVYLPLYYPFETVATGQGTILDGLERYLEDAPRVLSTYWCTWPPFHFVSFKFLPQELRVSFVAGLSFVWLVYLSWASHDHPAHHREAGDATTSAQSRTCVPAAAAAAAREVDVGGGPIVMPHGGHNLAPPPPR